MASDSLWDVVIVGGGPAGLTAALVLGRARRKVALIDEGQPRNQVAKQSHGFLSRDGMTQSAFYKVNHTQLEAYKNVSCIRSHVDHVQRDQYIFVTLTRSNEKIRSRKIIFASGLKDQLPPIPGLQEAYGKSIFPCPYCDGWELQEKPLAIFANGKHMYGYIQQIYQWSKDLIVFTNGPTCMTDIEWAALEKRRIKVIEKPIKQLRIKNGGELASVIVEGDQSVPRTAGFIQDTGAIQACLLPTQLGVHLNEKGCYETNRHGQTTCKGLYIIGDAQAYFSGLLGAAADGYEAGVQINRELVLEEWDRCSN
ncbi:NAD(P)/FAD-dependent oxidoreductase [Hazenella sp. IB182357]|uniref:NAD(P)/FAD-dependent oxidoreductase n=1 Tax=Polycladospora coralii TaxID=2771432 RepID=A0A926N8X1_9BACL|nr:NAD(P)/FAD-dependent oxidoreductase [Polycladospora coralii]MBD1371532.1 NAD(P)/FAD-dependent oxidoreductase [Polycladospora coralii]